MDEAKVRGWNVLPRAGWKPLIRETSTVPPSVAAPETASWSYWLPAVGAADVDVEGARRRSGCSCR